MKTYFIVLFFAVTFSTTVYGQSKHELVQDKIKIKFVAEGVEDYKLEIEPGFRYAEFLYEGRSYGLFYHRNVQKFSRMRIIDAETKEEVARGRGSLAIGDAQWKFKDGEKVEIRRNKNPNGYTIIGPYGPLFKVENQKIEPTKIYSDRDLLAQAFFVFDRVRSTQAPPLEIFWIYDPSLLSSIH